MRRYRHYRVFPAADQTRGMTLRVILCQSCREEFFMRLSLILA
ncbi:Uncharacterized protein ChrSV_1663 [Chromobacterium vaccinii]|nr:Uncharacterized protein ChrSW_1663 [Chromobacterium vaccinii]QND89121.1 Uncharacterized protein ChrSV_1663 [Chromobacterium vaccinii]